MNKLYRFILLAALTPITSFAATCNLDNMVQLNFTPAPFPTFATYSINLDNNYLKNCSATDLSSYLNKNPQISMAVLSSHQYNINNFTTTLNALDQVKTVQALAFFRLPNLGDAAVPLIAKTHFSSVFLYESGITDASLSAFAKMASLKWLDLSWNPITDQGVKSLSAIPALEKLSLSITNITDNSGSYLASLHINYLDLSQTQVGDNTATALASVTSLKALNMNGTQITNVGIAALASSTSLTDLQLEAIGALYGSDQSVALTALANNNTLTSLDLSFNSITDAGLEILSGNKHLQSLNIERNSFSDTGLLAVLNIPSLSSLSIGDVVLAPSTYQAISNRHISQLTIQNYIVNGNNLTDADVAAIATGATSELTVSFAGITDTQAATLASIPGLIYLDLDTNQLTDKSVSGLTLNPSIEYLDVSFNNLTNKGISVLQHTSNIKYLLSYGQDQQQAKQLAPKKIGVVQTLLEKTA